MPILNRLRQRLRNEEGFTMALVMGVMLSATIFGVAAWAAARGDIRPSAQSRDRKQAYAAAEAGLNWYLSRLAADPNYWTKCTAVGDSTAPINNQWNGSGTDPRIWRTLTGTTAQYTLELLPASGTNCTSATMIDTAGNFRIRATGKYHGLKRSIIARFNRRRFLDFIYFTDFETTDPAAYQASDQANAQQYCAGKYRLDRNATASTFQCREIQFGQFDSLVGPVHSNDSLFTCNATTFGEFSSDKIESSQNPGYYKACSTDPHFVGTWTPDADPLTMPSTNDALASVAGLKLTGTNILTLNNASITVQRVTGSGSSMAVASTTTVPFPSNGLIYVDNAGACSPVVPLLQDYTNEDGVCGNVYVSGTYSKDLTIDSNKDIIVRGDVKAASGSDAMLGLIATNFIRVYHPVTAHAGSGSCSGSNSSTSLYGSALTGGVTIEAAILSLQHGFTVDSYNCGNPMGTLTVKGAIAQRYRGAVATSSGGGSPVTGYSKAYSYDRRMQYRNPPLFLDPVNSRWRILRQNEQVPPR
jgi:hypothetical protein